MKFKIIYDYSHSTLTLDEHYHPLHEIVFIVQGEAKFNISNKEYYAKANSLLFINNFESHQTESLKSPYERYFILFSDDFLTSYVQDPILLSIIKQRPETFSHLVNLSGNVQTVNRFISEIFKEYTTPSDYTYDVIGHYLSLLLIHLYRNQSQDFPRSTTNHAFELAVRVQKYIEQNYTSDITLTKTAELFHVNMYYLSHLFKDVTGLTFKDYLISQRLFCAKELLINSSKNITEVCSLSGFNNVNHFIRLFRLREGITPLKFRKSHLL